MWIVNSRSGLCVNTSFVVRIIVADTDDSTLVTAVLPQESKMCTLERYADHKEAMDAVRQIHWALGEGRDVVEMPDSTYYYRERQIRDARAKRKGGS